MQSNSCNYLENLTRNSVIQVARSCCLEVDANMDYEAKLKHDMLLTHQNYVKIEKENIYLNLQVDDLESRLKYHNDQYVCLKYELEQLNRQKCELIVKLGENLEAQSDNQFEVNKSSETNVTQKNYSSEVGTSHFLDTKKLPKIFCVCGVHLKSDQTLKVHIRYHNCKVRFACNLCKVKTNGLNLLKKHMKRMHGVTEFPSSNGCRTCGKIFSTLKQLCEHNRREHGQKRMGETWEQNK